MALTGNGRRFRAVKVCGGTAWRRDWVKMSRSEGERRAANSTAKETHYHVCNRMIRIDGLGAWIDRERP
jgi:hypothetical protein